MPRTGTGTGEHEEDAATPWESKADRFRRLAEKRTQKALEEMRKIGNLANRMNYDYEPEQVDAILAALHEQIEAIRAKFDAKGESKQKFRLPE